MAALFEDQDSELRAALDSLDEPRGVSSDPWAPPGVRNIIETAICDRTKKVEDLCNWAAALMRIAALCAPRTHIEWLWYPGSGAHLQTLRSARFAAAIRHAVGARRIPADQIRIKDTGVELSEPAMRMIGDKPYDLAWGQMVQAAAFLDVLNALAYRRTADVLSGITRRASPAAQAADAARQLRGVLNDWLATRLESGHQREQAKTTHALLARYVAEHHGAKRLEPRAIDDAAILAFWGASAEERAGKSSKDDDSGLRRFKSAVVIALRYREALATALLRNAAAQGVSLGADAAAGDATEEMLYKSGRRSVEADSVEELLETALTDLSHSAGDWWSPLIALEAPPAGKIKWLTKSGYEPLAHYLGRFRGEATQNDVRAVASENRSGALMEGRPFDLGLLLTLLRVDAFDAAQSVATQRAREGLTWREAIARGLERVTDTAYLDIAARYREITAELRIAAYAALYQLAARRDAAALVLIQALADDRVREFIRETAERHAEDRSADNVVSIRPNERDAPLAVLGQLVGPWFDDKAAPPAEVAQFVAIFHRNRKLGRKGLSKKDLDDRSIDDALRAGAPELVRLLRALDALDRRLLREVPKCSPAADKAAFGDIMERLYGVTAGSLALHGREILAPNRG